MKFRAQGRPEAVLARVFHSGYTPVSMLFPRLFRIPFLNQRKGVTLMSSNKLKQFAVALLSAPLFFAASSASAKMIWQDFSLTYLQGNNYDPQALPNAPQTQAEKRRVITFEHASGHDWGGTFLFVDRLFSRDSDYPNDALYGEASANYNFMKPGGFIKNVYASGQVEIGRDDNGQDATFNRSNGNSFENILLGVGANLAVPGASFFNVILYHRLNDDQALDQTTGAQGFATGLFPRSRPDNQQLTVTWRFDFLNDMMRFDGFMDYATGFDFETVDPSNPIATKAENSLNFTPQLKMDFGSMFGYEAKKLWVGVEWVMWNNKFGVDGWNENNPNVLVKWHF